MEFKNELKCRENQLETIEAKLLKAKKTLHLLRYALVTSYYKTNEFESDEFTEGIDAQSRIHPAVKRLLPGNNLYNIRERRGNVATNTDITIKEEPMDDSSADSSKEPITHKGMETYFQNNYEMESLITKENPCHIQDNLKQEIVSQESPSLGFNRNLEEFAKSIDTDTKISGASFDRTRNRLRIKQRIIVGNISKWMPSECKEDNTTHKWMVYVRTAKDSQDISVFVDKVTFYLHPSYKPNDVVEVR